MSWHGEKAVGEKNHPSALGTEGFEIGAEEFFSPAANKILPMGTYFLDTGPKDYVQETKGNVKEISGSLK